MRIACCIPKGTNTQSEYVILTAFPLQQWLYERARMLGYAYIVVLLTVIIIWQVQGECLSSGIN